MDDPAAVFAKLRASNAERAGATPLPMGFRLTHDALLFFNPDDKDAPPLTICGPLRVEAATHDATSLAWGPLLSWKDANGTRHEWAMPHAMLAGDGQEVRAWLLDAGLFIGPGRKAREKLAEYLARCTPPERVHVVPRLGWHDTPGGRVFVLPDGALGGDGAAKLRLQTERPDALPPLVQSGTLAEWQQGLAAPAVGNSRLAFSLSIAFAAPLLGLLSAEGGGFHWRGPSSVGKSTALHAAGSVWGGGGLHGWCRSWRATDNALEAIAAAHSDLLLCLGEMGEAEPEVVGRCAYMLANGAGKGRANRDGGARRAAEWRLLFLSSGEVGIADRMAESRHGQKRARAGQEVRILDIPADTGCHGLFETLHGHDKAAALADALRGAAGRFYGTAGRAWLEHMAGDPDGIAAAAREVRDAFITANVPAHADGQVRRAAGRFGLVAAAGELAVAAGVLPWPAGEGTKAAAVCFKAWLRARAGGAGASEDAEAVALVRRFIAAHGDSRFQVIGADDALRVINRAGWKRREGDGWLYLIQPDIWRAEVVPGLDSQAAARAVNRAGFLVLESGRLQKSERVGATEPVRVYVVRDTILSGGADE